jgi:hypothetical protein
MEWSREGTKEFSFINNNKNRRKQVTDKKETCMGEREQVEEHI